MEIPRVVWVTGLSGAGKTTLAVKLVKELKARSKQVVLLDGDELREIFRSSESIEKNHSRDARLSLAFSYSKLTKNIANQGINVVIATISMFHEVHEWNRKHLPGYFEVFISVPINELRRRDPKGIYKRFDAGEISNVAGLDLEVDVPSNPHYILRYESADDHVHGILNLMYEGPP